MVLNENLSLPVQGGRPPNEKDRGAEAAAFPGVHPQCFCSRGPYPKCTYPTQDTCQEHTQGRARVTVPVVRDVLELLATAEGNPDAAAE